MTAFGAKRTFNLVFCPDNPSEGMGVASGWIAKAPVLIRESVRDLKQNIAMARVTRFTPTGQIISTQVWNSVQHALSSVGEPRTVRKSAMAATIGQFFG